MFVTTLGVACGGRSITETREGAGGVGGSYTPGAGGGGAVVGSGAVGGTVSAVGGASGAGGSVVVTPSGARPNHGGEGGGAGRLSSGGVAGDLGGSGGDAGAGFEVGGTSGTSGKAGAGGAGGKAGAGGAGGMVHGGSGDAGDAGAPGNQYPCNDPQEWEHSAVLCSDGFIHLPTRVACPGPSRDAAESGAAGDAGGPGSSPAGECGGDADCAANEYCLKQADVGRDCTATTNVCVRGCSLDSDCDAQSICLCDTHTKAATGATFNFGTCVHAECRADSDCYAGYLCRASPRGDACGTGPSVFACQTFEDQCGSDADCNPPDRCVYQDGSYICNY